jgi:hypothetical protein
VAILVTAWVSLWVRWSARAVPPALVVPAVPPWALALLLWAALALTRAALRNGPATPAARLGLVLGGVVAVFVTAWLTYGLRTPLDFLRRLIDWGDFISPVFLGVVACAFMWQQGIVLGRSAVPQEHLERAFFGGVAALALMFAVNQARPLLAPAETLSGVLAFFATGLGALSLVSVESARRWQGGPAGGSAWPRLNRYWLGTVAGVIGSILLAGLLVAALLSPDLFTRLDAALSGVANLLTVLVLILIGAMLVLVAWLMGPLLQRMAQALGENPFQFPTFPQIVEQAPQVEAFLDRYPVLNLLRQGLSLGLLLVAVGLVFWWAVRRLNRLRRSDADEERESIATRELLLQQLRSLLRRRPKTGTAGPPYLELLGPRDDPRLMVRRTYQAMLAWVVTQSLPPRRAAQTPAAYAATLAAYLPETHAALEALASVYALARYAGQPPSLAEVRVAQAALAAIQASRPQPNA